MSAISTAPLKTSRAGSSSSANRYSDGTTSFGRLPGVVSKANRGWACTGVDNNVANRSQVLH